MGEEKQLISIEEVKSLLHTILNGQYEVYKNGLRDSVVPVNFIITAFEEYFSIKEEVHF